MCYRLFQTFSETYLILKTQTIVMPVTLWLLNTVFLLLQTGAVHRYLLLLPSDGRLILEAGQIPELEVPGEGPAGGVDQEVRQLPDDVRERHEWEIIDLAQRQLSHLG